MTEEQSHQPEQEDYQGYVPPREPFTREELNNANQLRNTNFKPELHKNIEKSLLYSSAKRSLALIVDDFFADNRLLTNLTSSTRGKDNILGVSLDLERAVIFASASFCPSDLKNPDLTNIRNAIISHNRPTTLRTIGADRERKLQGKTTISSEQTISRQDTIVPQKPEPKKGFLSFLGGK